jgi:hypothetical protein
LGKLLATQLALDEIVCEFAEVNLGKKNIIDGIQLSNFLERDENNDVVSKHYKLWLTSTAVINILGNQSVFIDSEFLIDDINNIMPKFVQTEVFAEAHDILEKKNAVIITGDPGIGKTITSYMLIANLLDKGFHVRFASNGNISDLKNALSKDMNFKQVVLVDDFLGQHYLDMKSTTPREIKFLIAFAQKHKNTKIILNSRITISNEATRRFHEYKQLLQDKREMEIVIDHNRISDIEKARMLYNHLYFSGIELSYCSAIVHEQFYLKIVKHQNYNPRIIEFITNINELSNVSPDRYYDFIMTTLNNPSEIWRNEFEDRIKPEDRLFLECLYSLGNINVNIDILKEVFNTCLANKQDIDITVDVFNQSIERLSRSMIKQEFDYDNKLISVANPSINDFLKYHFENDVPAGEFILEHAVYCEQIQKLSNIVSLNGAIKKKFIEDMRIYDFKCFDLSSGRSADWHYVNLLILTHASDIINSDKVIRILTSRIARYEWLVKGLIKFENFDCVKLVNELSSVGELVDFMSYLEPSDIEGMYVLLDNDTKREFLNDFSTALATTVERDTYEALEKDNGEAISEALSKSSSSMYADKYGVHYDEWELWYHYHSIDEKTFDFIVDSSYSSYSLYRDAEIELEFDSSKYDPGVDWDQEVSNYLNADDSYDRWEGYSEPSLNNDKVIIEMFEGMDRRG